MSANKHGGFRQQFDDKNAADLPDEATIAERAAEVRAGWSKYRRQQAELEANTQPPVVFDITPVLNARPGGVKER